MGRQSRNICWLRYRMERAFIFSLQDLNYDPGQALHQTLDLSPETYPAHYNGAPACINTGSGEGRWCLCFSASAGTSSLPYLSLGELWKTPTKSSSLYQHPDGEKTEGHWEPPSKQSCRKGGSCLVCACERSGVQRKVQAPKQICVTQTDHCDGFLLAPCPHSHPLVPLCAPQRAVCSWVCLPCKNRRLLRGRQPIWTDLYPRHCSGHGRSTHQVSVAPKSLSRTLCMLSVNTS